MEKISKETIQMRYEWYLKHKEMWSKIVELLERGEKGEIDLYAVLGLTPLSYYYGNRLLVDIKEIVLKELGYNYLHSCAACQCMLNELHLHCGEVGCILKWNDSIKVLCSGYECEQHHLSPYKNMIDILDYFVARLYRGHRDPFPYDSLKDCAEEVRDLPFTYQEEYDAIMKGDK